MVHCFGLESPRLAFLMFVLDSPHFCFAMGGLDSPVYPPLGWTAHNFALCMVRHGWAGQPCVSTTGLDSLQKHTQHVEPFCFKPFAL